MSGHEWKQSGKGRYHVPIRRVKQSAATKYMIRNYGRFFRRDKERGYAARHMTELYAT